MDLGRLHVDGQAPLGALLLQQPQLGLQASCEAADRAVSSSRERVRGAACSGRSRLVPAQPPHLATATQSRQRTRAWGSGPPVPQGSDGSGQFPNPAHSPSTAIAQLLRPLP